MQVYNVLLVDDDPMTLAIYEAYLKDPVLHILKATSGAECFKQVNANSVSLIILDVGIPDMSGYEIAAKLQLTRETTDIPVVFITADTASLEAGKGYELGAVDFLTKPVNAKALKRKALVLVKKHEQHRMEMAELDAARKAEGKLHERIQQLEEHLAITLSFFPQAVFILDSGSRIADCNSKAESLLGLEKKAITSSQFTAFLSEKSRGELYGIISRSFSSGLAQEYTCTIVRKDGSEIAAHGSIAGSGTVAVCEITPDLQRS